LQAIQKKAQNLGFGDASTIYDIVNTVLSKTETDVSLQEAVSYYFKYKDYKVESTSVISSGNILYVPEYITKENCDIKITEAETAGLEKPLCEDALQAYTLLPKNDNWNLIKWFFRDAFK
jgi:hypothetical protein